MPPISHPLSCVRSVRSPGSSPAPWRASSTRPPIARCSGTRGTWAPSWRRSRRTSRIRAAAHWPSTSPLRPPRPPALVDAVFRLACGRSAAALSPRVPVGTWPLPGVKPGATADLSPAGLDPLTPPGAIGAHGEARWHATHDLSNAEPATVHLGLDVFAAEGAEVCAPVDGLVEAVAETEDRLS